MCLENPSITLNHFADDDKKELERRKIAENLHS